ncbi:hypothetical protein [Mycoplasmopsis bovis]
MPSSKGNICDKCGQKRRPDSLFSINSSLALSSITSYLK